MSPPRRPSQLHRSMSTPPATPTSATIKEPNSQRGHLAASVLTPPTSPQQSRSSSNISELATPVSAPYVPSSLIESKNKTHNPDPFQTAVSCHQPPTEPPVPSCPFEIEILKDDHNRDAIFGTGAWSIVYKATTHSKPSTTVQGPPDLTPPQSPIFTTPALVAVKKPIGRDAVSILESEAKILSCLHTVPDCEKYIVPFYGTVDGTTLILGALPFRLEDHIRKCSISAIQTASTWTMTEPVVGSTTKWLHLAHQLISALAWLHTTAHIIHGDIKPGNILLSHIRGSDVDITFNPIVADFSSSQRLDRAETTPNTLSAVTREYTAPELLSSSVLRDPKSTATTASDVFSLAVTLLVAATGQMLVYPGSVFQRQAMATQGWLVLSHVRGGEGGMRVPRFGVVETVLERAVLKTGMGRIGVMEWLELVEAVGKGEPTKL